MNYYVSKDVLETGLKILFVEMKTIDNKINSIEWQQYRKEKLEKLFQQYESIDVKIDPILEGFNILHDVTNVKRRKNIPASENLIKLLKKNNGELFFINTAVDIYNIISLESKLALGAHDLSCVEGNVTLRFTNGSEKYMPLGQSEPIKIKAGEYCYVDDSNEVLCRLEVRQVQKTAVTTQTKDVFYIVQGNKQTSDDLLEKTAKQIIQVTQTYLGGTGKIIVPSVLEN